MLILICLVILYILSYFGKMKQVTKVKFLAKEQIVFVIANDVMEYHDDLPNISISRMSAYE